MVDFDDKDIPIFLIAYATITVVAAVFAPKNTPESVKISILVSGQTALGGAAGMSRTSKGKEITNKIDSVGEITQQKDGFDGEQSNHFKSSNDNIPYK